MHEKLNQAQITNTSTPRPTITPPILQTEPITAKDHVTFDVHNQTNLTSQHNNISNLNMTGGQQLPHPFSMDQSSSPILVESPDQSRNPLFLAGLGLGQGLGSQGNHQ